MANDTGPDARQQTEEALLREFEEATIESWKGLHRNDPTPRYLAAKAKLRAALRALSAPPAEGGEATDKRSGSAQSEVTAVAAGASASESVGAPAAAPEGTEAPPDEWTEARSRAWYAVVETLYDLGFRYSSEGDRTGLEDVLAFIRELAERPASSPETGNEKMDDVWEVSGHVRVHATGDTLREAVERFLMAYPEADLPEAWEHGEEGGTIIGACEGCDRLLLDEDEYRVVDEDGTRLCPKCVAEETQ